MTTDQQTADVERGPNGIPYAQNDRTKVAQWETGDYYVRLAREDGDILNANFREAQLKVLREAIDQVLNESDP